MDCKMCLRAGTTRNGGTIGLCWSHARRRCHICGSFSAGEHYCESCNHKTDITRWKAQADFKIIDPEIEEELQVREEMLIGAKRHLFVASENIILALSQCVRALHGKVPDKTIEETDKAA